MSRMRVAILGAGVVGLTAAFELARRGVAVDVFERRAGPGLGCSFYAGGMLAPWCERESAEQTVVDLGVEGLAFWTGVFPVARQTGTLLVAPPRDRADLARFAKRATQFEPCDERRIAALEPDLAGRFPAGLFFPQEAYLEPRAALDDLARALAGMGGVRLHFATEAPAAPSQAGFAVTLDCRGWAARDRLADLRGVKGEMLVLRGGGLVLSRPVRMVHPRRPVYIVPRADGSFMIGATMIENEEPGRVTARGVMELLGSAYTLHPALGEAELLETGCDVRPAFADNLPRLRVAGDRIYLNGLYRHGFLLAPALAARAADIVTNGAAFPELDR